MRQSLHSILALTHLAHYLHQTLDIDEVNHLHPRGLTGVVSCCHDVQHGIDNWRVNRLAQDFCMYHLMSVCILDV